MCSGCNVRRAFGIDGVRRAGGWNAFATRLDPGVTRDAWDAWPPARATVKIQNLTETTPTVALTRGMLSQRRGRGGGRGVLTISRIRSRAADVQGRVSRAPRRRSPPMPCTSSHPTAEGALGLHRLHDLLVRLWHCLGAGAGVGRSPDRLGLQRRIAGQSDRELRGAARTLRFGQQRVVAGRLFVDLPWGLGGHVAEWARGFGGRVGLAVLWYDGARPAPHRSGVVHQGNCSAEQNDGAGHPHPLRPSPPV